jgi:perosamine synthetase
VDGIADRRRRIAETYRMLLDGAVTFQDCPSRATNANWMVSVVLPVASAVQRDEVAGTLRQRGIDTRPFFYPVHTMDPYASSNREPLPVATRLAARGISLPTWPGLKDDDLARVADELRRALGR